MPFPFTFGSNTYTRDDFTTPGYSSKLPRFMEDLLVHEDLQGSSEVLSTVDFSANTHSITFSDEWVSVGDTLILYHRETGGYVHVKVDGVSGTTATAVSEFSLPYNLLDTYTSGVTAVLSVPRNYPTGPYSTDYDVSVLSNQIHSVDFLEDFVTITGGNYTGDNNTSESLSQVVGPPLSIDIFSTNGNGSEVSPSYSNFPGRGWAKFKTDLYSAYHIGGYFGSLRTCTWSQWCVLPNIATARLFVGWQAFPSSPGPQPLLGYPHEFVHGPSLCGPFVDIAQNSFTGGVSIKVGNGTNSITLPESDTNPLVLSLKPLTVELSTHLSDILYRIYTEDAEVSGTLPASPVPLMSGVFRPYFGGKGEYLVDYFWARSSV